jgi:chemotaxis protein MotB
MADKDKGMIVIKKITIAGAGAHGGAWKVAFADFMTAMMAFFLVMWLLGQSEETKKAVSDYFSTPSVIEYSFQNFGVELTLEKLFIDILNEPLKAFQNFMEPMDKTPNILDFGSQKVVIAYMADQLGDLAKNVNIQEDGVEFLIQDIDLFEKGSSNPNKTFYGAMEKIKTITMGLEDTDVKITSMLFHQSVVDRSPETAQKVASERLEIVKKKIESTLENSSASVIGGVSTESKKDFVEGQALPPGLIKIKLQQKPLKSDGNKPKKLENLFGSSDSKLNAYDNFIKQATSSKKKKTKDND